MSRFFPIIVLLALMGTGCNQAPDAPDGPRNEAEVAAADAGKQSDVELADSRWRLVSMGGEPVAKAGGGNRVPGLSISSDGRVSGFGGCNQFSGQYELDGERLSFGPIASTKMACPRIGDLERRYFSAISDTAAYRIDGQTIVLLDGDGKELARLERSSGPEAK